MILFHSFEFILFFTILYVIYWRLRQKHQNWLLLASSYLFYASWDWRFLGVILLSTGVDYVCGHKIHNSDKPLTRKIYLLFSLGVNLGLLFFFKYCGFFVENMLALLGKLGYYPPEISLQIILPLGISFYTFQSISYTLDIYRKKITPTKRFSNFCLFVAFFPQLIAGPIEKARDLLPQIEGERDRKKYCVKESLYLFIYGAFKKVVIADSLAKVVETTYHQTSPSGIIVLLGLYAFAIQLYCDFSGYSNMARGLSQLLGIRLSVNFNLPFFSKNYFEFYKRWHITLCNWIAEYVYTPLFFHLSSKGFLSRISSTQIKMTLAAIIALFVTRFMFGVWHGASWTFVGLAVFIFVAQMMAVGWGHLMRSFQFSFLKKGQYFLSILKGLLMFHIFCYAMLFFRAENIGQVMEFTQALIFRMQLSNDLSQYWILAVFMSFLLIYESIQKIKEDQLWILKRGFFVQSIFYAILFIMYINLASTGDERFIYFQF